jgi:hypothetical protein
MLAPTDEVATVRQEQQGPAHFSSKKCAGPELNPRFKKPQKPPKCFNPDFCSIQLLTVV